MRLVEKIKHRKNITIQEQMGTDPNLAVDEITENRRATLIRFYSFLTSLLLVKLQVQLLQLSQLSQRMKIMLLSSF